MDPLRELPMGFGILLLQNPQASLAFYDLDAQGQQNILDQTHSASSQSEMRALVDRLAQDYHGPAPKTM